MSQFAPYCYLDAGERQFLESPQRPIVLLPRRPDSPVSEHVAPRNQFLGVMLPYTPLHYLLLETDADYAPLALVMTSGNMSEEPIAIDNDEALRRHHRPGGRAAGGHGADAHRRGRHPRGQHAGRGAAAPHLLTHHIKRLTISPS
ncbi:MAG: Sua5/YciO/YrdC/YwlC family protein [Chloroflexi bacterium]|nr:Sua5/YciO/YrdC/YwlC family protein [Chloroflexota bacterium]